MRAVILLFKSIGVVQTDEDFRSAVSIILPDSGYARCPGLPTVEYEDVFSVVHHHTKGVHVIEAPIKRYESDFCVRWHKPSNGKNRVGTSLHDVCANCKKVSFLEWD